MVHPYTHTLPVLPFLQYFRKYLYLLFLGTFYGFIGLFGAIPLFGYYARRNGWKVASNGFCKMKANEDFDAYNLTH